MPSLLFFQGEGLAIEKNPAGFLATKPVCKEDLSLGERSGRGFYTSPQSISPARAAPIRLDCSTSVNSTYRFLSPQRNSEKYFSNRIFKLCSL